MSINEAKTEIDDLRRQLRQLEKTFVEFRKSNGESMSDFAWVIIKMETAIARMDRALRRIEEGRQ